MQDKVVVIVGATGGIGSALTQKLASTGIWCCRFQQVHGRGTQAFWYQVHAILLW